MSDLRLQRLLLADQTIVAAAVAWGEIQKCDKRAARLVEWGPGVWYDPLAWMLAAGLPSSEHDRLAQRLRVLGMIDHQGEVWAPLLSLARSQAARMLGKRGRDGAA